MARGTGMIRPGTLRSLQAFSIAIASAVVWNVTTSLSSFFLISYYSLFCYLWKCKTDFTWTFPAICGFLPTCKIPFALPCDYGYSYFTCGSQQTVKPCSTWIFSIPLILARLWGKFKGYFSQTPAAEFINDKGCGLAVVQFAALFYAVPVLGNLR